jgi:hypothetical protein
LLEFVTMRLAGPGAPLAQQHGDGYGSGTATGTARVRLGHGSGTATGTARARRRVRLGHVDLGCDAPAGVPTSPSSAEPSFPLWLRCRFSLASGHLRLST